MRNKQLLDTYTSQLPPHAQAEYGSRAEKFLNWVDERELNAEMVRKWLEKLKRDSYADGSIRKDFGIIRRLFRVNNIPWTFKRGDAPIIREKEVWAPALDPNDIKAMVDVVLGREPTQGPVPKLIHRVCLELSTLYGLRLQEMQTVTAETVDFNNTLIYVETAKKGRQRYHLIPEAIFLDLKEWGFTRPLSKSSYSYIFGDLKTMIGLNIPNDLGWHAIRRSLAKGLQDAGLPEYQVNMFLRWKRGGSNMALRYAQTPVVGRQGVQPGMAMEDRRLDEQVFEKFHPFLKFWV